MGLSGYACTAECCRSRGLCPYGAVSALFLCCAVSGRFRAWCGRVFRRAGRPAPLSSCPRFPRPLFRRGRFLQGFPSGKRKISSQLLHKAFPPHEASPATERVAACSCAFMGHFRLCLHGRVPQKQGSVPLWGCFRVVSVLCRLRPLSGMVRPCFPQGGKACAPFFQPHVSRAPFRRGGDCGSA